MPSVALNGAMPLAILVFAIVVVAVALWGLFAWLRELLFGTRLSYKRERDGTSQKKVHAELAQASELKRKGRLAEAAWLYERNRVLGQAAECYLKSGDPLWAAELLGRAGDARRAAQLYSTNGYYQRATAILAKGKRYDLAAQLHLQLNQLEEAAGYLEQAGQKAKAAALLLGLGKLLPAGRLFREAGEKKRAAKVLARVVREQGASSLAGVDGADQLLLDHGFAAESARVAALGGRPLQALLASIAAGQVSGAAAILKAGDEQLRGQVLAEVQAGRISGNEVVKMAELANDGALASIIREGQGRHLEAARFAETARQDGRAAQLFARAGKPAEAALAFTRAKRYREAAEQFQKAGNSAAAAEAHIAGESFFPAGRLLEQEGRLAEALAAYQRVPSGHRDTMGARAAAGLLLHQTGDDDAALEALGQLTHSRPDSYPAAWCLWIELLVERDQYGSAIGLGERLLKAGVDGGPTADAIALWRTRASELGQTAAPSAPAQSAAAELTGSFISPAPPAMGETLGDPLGGGAGTMDVGLDSQDAAPLLTGGGQLLGMEPILPGEESEELPAFGDHPAVATMADLEPQQPPEEGGFGADLSGGFNVDSLLTGGVAETLLPPPHETAGFALHSDVSEVEEPAEGGGLAAIGVDLTQVEESGDDLQRLLEEGVGPEATRSDEYNLEGGVQDAAQLGRLLASSGPGVPDPVAAPARRVDGPAFLRAGGSDGESTFELDDTPDESAEVTIERSAEFSAELSNEAVLASTRQLPPAPAPEHRPRMRGWVPPNHPSSRQQKVGPGPKPTPRQSGGPPERPVRAPLVPQPDRERRGVRRPPPGAAELEVATRIAAPLLDEPSSEQSGGRMLAGRAEVWRPPEPAAFNDFSELEERSESEALHATSDVPAAPEVMEAQEVHARLAFLRQVHPLKRLPSADLRRVAALMSEVTASPGEDVTRARRYLAVVKRGTVRLRENAGLGRPLGVGACIGLDSLRTDAPRTPIAVAHLPATVLFLGATGLASLRRADPTLLERIQRLGSS